MRVVFGVTSCLFFSNGTIHHHFLKYELAYLKFVDKFLEDIYIYRRCYLGANTVPEGKEFYNLAKLIMLETGFDLRKWVTNNSTLQKDFNEKENLRFSKNHSFTENDDCTFLVSEIKFVANDLKLVFGIEWDIPNDEFFFHISSLIDLARSLETAKRNVLKISSSSYDPLGLISRDEILL